MQTFFVEADYEYYITLMAKWCKRFDVTVWRIEYGVPLIPPASADLVPRAREKAIKYGVPLIKERGRRQLRGCAKITSHERA
jgi:hypothetical protein